MIVREVMSAPVFAIEPTERLLDAFNLMIRHQIKHLPVVENDQLVGLISDRDLLGHAVRENGAYVFPRQSVETIMIKDVITCRPEDKLEDTLGLMLKEDISCLPVVENGLIVGIVTSRSFLKQMHCQETGKR
ncbi:MAG: CBS domain-containing protein [Oligoflexus sp.]